MEFCCLFTRRSWMVRLQKKFWTWKRVTRNRRKRKSFWNKLQTKALSNFSTKQLTRGLHCFPRKAKEREKASPGNASLPSAELTLAAVHSSTGTLDKQELQNIIADCPNHELSRPKPKSKSKGEGSFWKRQRQELRENRRAKAKIKPATSLRGKAKVAKAQASRVASQKNGLFPLRKGAKVQNKGAGGKTSYKGWSSGVTARRWQR